MIKNLLVSFSGGQTSAFMAYHILHSEKYEKIKKLFVFANTGKEHESTLIFVKKFQEYFRVEINWIEAVVTLKDGIGVEAITTNYEKASRNGEPFEAIIAKKNQNKIFGVPNPQAPYCSENLKKTPIHKFAKEYFKDNYYTAIGFRYEDYITNRITKPEINQFGLDNKIYPLLQDFKHYVTKKEIDDFWLQMPFRLQIPSFMGNCDLCYKKSFAKKKNIIQQDKNVANWWVEMEKKYGGEFHYGNIKTEEILSMPIQKSLFDVEYSCMC